MALEEYNRFSDKDRIARDANLEITEAFFPPYFESFQLLDIGDNDPAKVGAIATFKDGTKTNLAIYQGGGTWTVGTGYTDAEIDAMITAAKNRANHTGTQAINTIEGLEAALDGKISTSEKGVSNGVATLDGGGKVPANQLPNSVMTVEGPWNAATNTPTLSNGTGNAGMVYEVTTAGTVNLGDGNITFKVGDWAVYGADGKWYKSVNSNEVTSVNGKTGSVIIAPGDLDVSNGLFIVGNSSGKGGTRKILPSDMGLTSGGVLYALSPSVWSELFASDNATPSTVAIRSAASSSSPGEIKAGPAVNPEGLVRLDQMNSALAAKAPANSETLQSVISRGNLIDPGDPNAFAWNRSDGPDNKWGLKYDPTYKGMNFVRYGLQDGVLFLRDVNNYVGIGTVIPAYKLHVNGDFGVGNMYTEGALRFFNPSGNINTRRHWLQANANTNGDISIYSQNNDGSGNRFDFYISPLGNIGLGTVDPTAKLEVAGAIKTSDKTRSALLSYTGTSGVVGTESNHPLDIWTNSSSKMTILPNGNVGVGTNNPAAKLDVNGWTQSNQGFRSYATANSNAAYSPTGITFNTAANTYATIDANSSGGLVIRTADGSATAQPRMTFLTSSSATARSVSISGRAHYTGDYTGSFEANDLVHKKYVDDKVQLITLRSTISGGVAVLDGGAVESGFRYIVQGASLYNGTTPEFLSLSKLAIQAGTTGNVVAQYETTSVDNGKDVEVLILKIKI